MAKLEKKKKKKKISQEFSVKGRKGPRVQERALLGLRIDL